MQHTGVTATTAPTDEAAFLIRAMDCPEELALIERGLRPLAGVHDVRADFLTRTLTVAYDASQTGAAQLAERLAAIGFAPAEPTRGAEPAAAPLVDWRRRATLVAGALLAAAAVAHFVGLTLGAAAAAIAAAIIAGVPVARAGLRAVRIGGLDMNALMTIAATGAIAIGDYFEAATAMFLFNVALWLESASLERARRAVRSLVTFQTPLAHRRANGAWTDVDPDAVRVGDELLIKPGERLPVDGVVIAGQSALNQAPITGESLPVDVAAGVNVFAGSLNGEGAIEIRATRVAADSTLAHIARLVSQAQADRSPTARFVDRFARVYTPAVIALALLIAMGPPLFAVISGSPAAWTDWLHRGLVMLVIACPCALVISTPVTIVCGLHQAARRGALVKGGEHLERLAQVDAMAFDKTGTLTVGRPHVAAVVPVAGLAEAEVLAVAAALEEHSEHPLARAIVAAARARGLDVPAADAVQAHRGFGVEGRIADVPHVVGSRRMFVERGLAIDGQLELAESSDDTTLVLVARHDRLLGAIRLADEPRTDAAAGIVELRKLGIAPLVLLSGDRAATAQSIAAGLGLDEARGDLLPADKLRAIGELATRYPHLAMVGDGVNDAPALAAAPVGIALGSAASDTALETADVVVMAPRVAKIADLVRLARRCRATLRQNIALSLAIKAAVFAVAAAGWGTMWLAVAADVGASLLVIANGLRLLRS